MDAHPLLARIARMLEEHGLEAVLIGNAAAALQGAPVSTVDLDFMFRKTPANLRKLRALATDLEAVIMRPYYPASGLFRIVRDNDGLQIDFMATVHGVRSLASLRSRAQKVTLDGAQLLVADLSDIIKSKRATGRPKDTAALNILEKTLHEKTRDQKRKTGSSEERE